VAKRGSYDAALPAILRPGIGTHLVEWPMSSLGLVFVSLCLANPPPAPAAKPTPAANSDAEKIARLQRYIDEDEKELARVKQQLDDPNGDFQRADAAFREIDGLWLKKNRELGQLKKDGKKAEAEALEKELKSLKSKRQRAQDEFDLAIQERKTLQERAASLPQKIARQKKAIEGLMGIASQPPAAEKKCENETKSLSESTRTVQEKKPESDKPAETAAEKTARESKRLKEAREAARLKEEQSLKALDRVNTIKEYLEGIQRQVDLEKRLLETARKKLTLARQNHADLEEEQKKLEMAGNAADIAAGRQRLQNALQRVDEAVAEEHDSSDRLTDMQGQFARAQAKLLEAKEAAEESKRGLEDANKKINDLENPFNPHNVLQWLHDHGPKLLIIIASMFLLHTIVRLSSKRIEHVVAAGKLHTGREGEDRAVTLVSVFRAAVSTFIFVGGSLMLLDEMGIPIVPLMGGAAVFGLAVAFGAQNLIKDYFTGFMVLLEDQYAVNDVVKINNVGGKVERITMRMTVLRDNGGVAHFVPHGSITTVSNMSHGWAKANLEIGISFKEDADRVLDLLRELGAEMRQDETFGPMILEDAEVPGIDSFGESAVILKMMVKTKATKQWDVKRELLRRIKLRFDQLGIEMPFPSQTLYLRQEGVGHDARLAA
jgi:small conductance mechanosensitive channel